MLATSPISTGSETTPTDRNRACFALSGQSPSTPRHNHVDLKANELGNHLPLLSRSIGNPVLDDDVLALDVAEITQPLPDCVDPCWWAHAGLQQSDARYLPRFMLRLYAERRSEC